jgi:hypothetical protein
VAIRIVASFVEFFNIFNWLVSLNPRALQEVLQASLPQSTPSSDSS